MGWERKPEPEVMDNDAEAEAYASAAAQNYLDALDDTLVAQALSLFSRAGAPSGRLLDLGCGPGNIALKLAQKAPGLRVVGVDCSRAMIHQALRAAEKQGLFDRARFLQGDGNRLCFPDASFDYVLSNSVLHHLANPTRVLREMVRVTRPTGVILMRDLRRPSRLFYRWHVGWHGRYYSGLMKKLYRDSVRAAFTVAELKHLLAQAGLEGATVFTHRRTHLGFVLDFKNRRAM